MRTCKAAIPHLTKLQKEYEGKATFISVNVWEKMKEGQAYESSLPNVTAFVQGNSANMGFSVFADKNDQHMGNNWLHAAGEKEIPSTFIIIVNDGDKLSNSTYLWSAKLIEEYYLNKKPLPMFFHALASVYAKGGRLSEGHRL